eukprot:TRINITY_DN2688_c0_g1_i2.p1 TRINITY_DN2688_c0_g1~~TRINITY_DN2688_c0_g1_i2.p1  ORF type:complete len:168 (+),score=11.78 TRINITY_DN2688_c0_g1_i2:31-534(+)
MSMINDDPCDLKIDIEPIRKHVELSLKDRYKEYRDAITDFLLCKLTKSELDELVRSVFGNETKAHNLLISSLIFNAQHDIAGSMSKYGLEPNPLSVQTSTKHAAASLPAYAPGKKKIKVEKTSAPGTPAAVTSSTSTIRSSPRITPAGTLEKVEPVTSQRTRSSSRV